MKKFLPAVLAALLLFLSACNSPAAEDTPEPTPESTYTPLPMPTWWIDPRPTINFDGPMIFYPFVYNEEPGWAWAREIIGDCSALVPGYLYLQDLRTKEITQIIEEPVNMFRSDNEILYCLVDGSSILRTNYWGEDQTVLYSAQYGALASLEYWEGVLLFSDGDHVIRFDVETKQEEDMGIYEGITDLYFAEDGTFTWRNAEGIEYARDENGHDEIVPDWGYYDGPLEIEEES